VYGREGATLNSVIDEWFTAYCDDVYNFLVYFTGTLDVEDLVQETFLRAMKGLSSFRHDANPKTWLLRIARNLAIDSVRRKQKVKFVSENELLSLPSRDLDPERAVEAAETTRVILDLLQQVNPKFRDVLLLRGVCDLSISDTAAILGWSESKVKATYHRAITAARQLVPKVHEGGLTNGG
jgi:RNA polymerase sigma-70 factor (ECF subfamily)